MTAMGTDHHDQTAALPDREITPEQADGPVDLETAIARQVRRYRIAAGLSVAEMAARVGISKAMLSKIENAHTSCSLTTLGRLATGLNVPVTALFRGVDTEREAVYVPMGPRRPDHPPRQPGRSPLRTPRRPARPPQTHGSRPGHPHRVQRGLPLFQHPGTELLFMLEGVMVYGHGEAAYTMRPGDALQLDGEGAHGPQELVELPVRFLSVTAFGDHGRD